MHKRVDVPSTYHQYVKYALQRGQGTITADNNPVSSVAAYHVKERYYKVKGKEVAKDDDVTAAVLIRHPLVGFTQLMTSLECSTIDTYHQFEDPKKMMPKSRSSFIDKRWRYGQAW